MGNEFRSNPHNFLGDIKVAEITWHMPEWSAISLFMAKCIQSYTQFKAQVQLCAVSASRAALDIGSDSIYPSEL